MTTNVIRSDEGVVEGVKYPSENEALTNKDIGLLGGFAIVVGAVGLIVGWRERSDTKKIARN